MRAASIDFFRHLGDVSHLSIFIDALKDPFWAVRSIALSSLVEFGDKSAIQQVMKLVVGGRKKNLKYGVGESEIRMGLQYLQKFYSENDDVREFLNKCG